MKEELVKYMLHRLSNSVGIAMNNLYLDKEIESFKAPLYLIKSELVLFRKLLTQENLTDSKKDLERVLATKDIKICTKEPINRQLIAVLLIFTECANGGELKIFTRDGKVNLEYSKQLPERFGTELETSPLACYKPKVEFTSSYSFCFTPS